jgi:hypothetical protein
MQRPKMPLMKIPSERKLKQLDNPFRMIMKFEYEDVWKKGKQTKLQVYKYAPIDVNHDVIIIIVRSDQGGRQKNKTKKS